MKRPFKPRFIKLSYFVWVIVSVGLWFTYDTIGLPHGIWSYSWIDQGQGMDPFAHRTYTRCRFSLKTCWTGSLRRTALLW